MNLPLTGRGSAARRSIQAFALRSSVCLLILGCLPVMAAQAESPQDLSGKWRFRLDAADEGVPGQWFAAPLTGNDTIKLPGTTDEAGYGDKTIGAATGVLTRVVRYFGPAWYQRELDIPQAWQDQQVELFLERVLWQSRVWVDGRACGEQESLNTPHIHSLGKLSPGKHTLTVRIDNRPLYPIGIAGHSYTEQTQTIWNGAVGRIELRAYPVVSIARTRVFPNASEKKVDAEVSLHHAGDQECPVTLRLELRKRGSDEVVGHAETTYTVKPGETIVRPAITLAAQPDAWDEFAPNLYTLDVTAGTGKTADHDRQTFGFRTVTRVGQHVAINGRPAFFRGNLDCVHFPLTGYPAMDVAGWKRIFQIYRDYGLNHVRFHTWTPPEAAFIAADELGIYIQCEVIWVQRHLGKDKPGRMESMGKIGSIPESLLNPPGIIDGYVHDEMRRVVDAYGNHPSFVFFAIGNEMGSFDPEVCGGWIQELKTYDPRHFYSVTTARRVVPQDDFNVTHVIPGVGGCRDRAEPGNDWDYENVYSRASVPTIAHETGQWPTYPTWDEIVKYTGVLQARNFERFRQLARENGVESLDREFHAASGALSLRLYKDQIESHLRTPSCAGFQLLSMQDFSGQGEALVGWLDAFYDSKGTVTPERFRRWCQATVPLVRMPTCIFEAGDTLSAKVEVAHYGPTPLKDAKVSWSLRAADGTELASGRFAPVALPISKVTQVGVATTTLDRCPASCSARLEVRIEGTPFANDWDVWVFQKEHSSEPQAAVICDSIEAALESLRAGRKVLLDAHALGTSINVNYARFKPAYWSTLFFRRQYTLGAYVRNEHPALAGFPTQNHYDWQWEALCESARAFRLGDFPLEYQPIVQPIGDFHNGWKLGTVFEMRVGQGQLLVCGYDVTTNLAARPAARQLRASLLGYLNSPKFAPATSIEESVLTRMFPILRVAPVAMPDHFETAVLYVKAGAKHPSVGTVRWNPQVDEARIGEPGFGYKVSCNEVWKDSVGTAWVMHGRGKVEVTVPAANLYDLYVHFHDWNNRGRRATLQFEGRLYQLNEYAGKGKWIKLEVLREDCRDGKLNLDVTTTAGPNTQITAIALVPR